MMRQPCEHISKTSMPLAHEFVDNKHLGIIVQKFRPDLFEYEEVYKKITRILSFQGRKLKRLR